MSDPVPTKILGKLGGAEPFCLSPCSPALCDCDYYQTEAAEATLTLTPAELRLLRMAVAASRLALTRKELPDWRSFKSKLDAL